MFKKLKRAAKTPVKLTFELTVSDVQRLPVQYGKLKVAWGRGGHWHESAAVQIVKGKPSRPWLLDRSI